jgi:hypothetical protein
MIKQGNEVWTVFVLRRHTLQDFTHINFYKEAHTIQWLVMQTRNFLSESSEQNQKSREEKRKEEHKKMLVFCCCSQDTQLLKEIFS